MDTSIQIITAFGFGVVFIISLLALSVKFPNPTAFQYNVFRIILALAAGGAAAMIPGFIEIEVNRVEEVMIRAGGAIAVFCIVYFFNPAQIAVDTHASEKPDTDESEGNLNPLFQPIWDQLDAKLQDALVLAATAAQRENKDYISTTTLFSAIRRINPEPLPEFFNSIPQEAVPETIPQEVSSDINSLSKVRSFSPCVQSSLNELAPKATFEHKLASEDILVDIARHGTGKSVSRLRTHGVDSEKVRKIVSQLGWTLISRENPQLNENSN